MGHPEEDAEPRRATWDADRREALARQVADFYALLDGLEIVGFPKHATDMSQLDRLIALYPDEARRLLDR